MDDDYYMQKIYNDYVKIVMVIIRFYCVLSFPVYSWYFNIC